MPVYKTNDTMPPAPVIVLLFGEPGVSKTSLANTAKNPILLDFDRGSKRSVGRPDTLVLEKGWPEVETEEAQGTFNGYATVIIDTAKSALDDFLMEFVISKDATLRKNKLKMYGAIADEFKLFVNKRRAANQDLIIIAHAKYKEEGDSTRYIPDVTGGSLQLLLRIADQVCFMTTENDKRTIQFNPTDKTVGKNVAGLPKIVLPLHTDPAWKDFMDREIVQKVKDAIGKQSEEQKKALAELQVWYEGIDLLTDNVGLIDFIKSVGDISELHIKKQVETYFKNHYKLKLKMKYDGATKSFIKIDAPVVPEVPATEETPSA